jgi:hypothetical protein
MRTYIELRNASGVRDWRVIIDPADATAELISERVRELTWSGLSAGDTISIYESELEAKDLKLR